jgi:hypothetical protein
LIHHFRCAELREEEAFRVGADLICPKCRQQLRHYGRDYDKPGTVLRCAACGTSNSEPAIGFSCQDCGAHTDGEAASTRDIYAYTLTEEAVARLTGPELQVTAPRESHAAEAERARLLREDVGAATAAAVIHYGARDRIIAARGEAAFRKLRDLFIENLRNFITEIGRVRCEGETDWLILEETDPEELARLASRLLQECEAVLAERIEPRFEIVDPRTRIVS